MNTFHQLFFRLLCRVWGGRHFFLDGGKKQNSSRTRQHTLSTLVTPTSVTFYGLKKILHPHLQKQPELFRYIYYLYWQQHCLVVTLGKWAICDCIAE